MSLLVRQVRKVYPSVFRYSLLVRAVSSGGMGGFGAGIQFDHDDLHLRALFQQIQHGRQVDFALAQRDSTRPSAGRRSNPSDARGGSTAGNL